MHTIRVCYTPHMNRENPLDTYAGRLQHALKLAEIKGRGPSIRTLADRLNVSYEHVRRILAGEPVVSEDLNKKLSDTLGLDAEEMFRVAIREKMRRRFPDADLGTPETGSRIDKLWQELGTAQKQALISIAEAFVAKNAADRSTRAEQVTQRQKSVSHNSISSARRSRRRLE